LKLNEKGDGAGFGFGVGFEATGGVATTPGLGFITVAVDVGDKAGSETAGADTSTGIEVFVTDTGASTAIDVEDVDEVSDSLGAMGFVDGGDDAAVVEIDFNALVKLFVNAAKLNPFATAVLVLEAGDADGLTAAGIAVAVLFLPATGRSSMTLSASASTITASSFIDANMISGTGVVTTVGWMGASMVAETSAVVSGFDALTGIVLSAAVELSVELTAGSFSAANVAACSASSSKNTFIASDVD
jgi:hypothetical protein